MWTKEYEALVNRNIGLISQSQQEVLKNSCVAIFGLGGLGGVISEILVRSGVCAFKIADHDKFDPTNMNRQIFAFRDTVGKMKTDVTEEFLRKINPEIKVDKYTEITPENIGKILEKVNVAVLAVDKVKPCIIISRAARKMNIPLVEGWAIPFSNVRVFTKDRPSLEEVYHLPTVNKDISSISDDEFNKLNQQMLMTLEKIEGIEAFYPPNAVERILKGENPTLAPLVWLTAVAMGLEAIKVILNWGKIAYSPSFALYDPFSDTTPKQEH